MRCAVPSASMTPGPVRRRLADGREILYFDDAAGRRHDAVDTRRLDPVISDTESRWDPVFGGWTVLAGQRQDRTYHPPAGLCPLCPKRGELATEVPDPSYDVVVFENRFPSLTGMGAHPYADVADSQPVPGYGRCEVVVPTDDHSLGIADLPARRVRTLIDAWAQRTQELSSRPDIASVSVFENRGDAVGVTLDHTHQQIYAFPFVPPVTARFTDNIAHHRANTGRCLVCDQLDRELAAGDRVVTHGVAWSVVVPFAARWPFEVNVVPHRHLRDLPALDDAERDELAEVWRDLFRRYDALFDQPRLPTIAAWHQTPSAAVDGHLFAQLFSVQRNATKLKYLAGTESAYGQWVLDASPEHAAEMLRAAG
jgi:UDPglucose--hexose-1-phosphate uridylyltransferase